VHLAPGLNSDERELDPRLSNASVEQLRAQNAGSHSLWSEISATVHGDLGTAKTYNRPVRELIAQRLPETFDTMGRALAMAWALAVAVLGLGWICDLRSIRVGGALSSTAIVAIPYSVLALAGLVFSWSAALVVAILIFAKVNGYLSRIISQCAQQPFVLSAHARGLSRVRIFFCHLVPASAPQLLALIGISFNVALAACVPVEALLDRPGIGQLAWQAALGRDVQLLLPLTAMIAAGSRLCTAAADSAAELLGWSAA
jgi:peptide/nickel transport system permease protein